MSRLLDDDDQDDLPQRERELTLSTGAILAIFVGLMLLCAVFFGFGYNMGRKSSTTPSATLPHATSDSDSGETANSAFDTFKPSPGSPTATPTTSSANTTASSAAPRPGSASRALPPASPENATPTPMSAATQPAPAPLHTASPTPESRVTTTITPAPAHTAQPPAAPKPTPGGAFVVQIAAISPTHKDDADLLANALHNKGYDVAERAGTQDKLIHIQVGPFATKADAEAMRERLIVDGYNAIVK